MAASFTSMPTVAAISTMMTPPRRNLLAITAKGQ